MKRGLPQDEVRNPKFEAQKKPAARSLNVRRVWAAVRVGSALAVALWAGPGCSPDRAAQDEGADAHAGHDHGEAGHAEAGMCAEHGVPEIECAICQPQRAAELKPGQSLQVRLPSPDSATVAGVRTEPARAAMLSEGVECLVELAFNQSRYAHVVAPVAGILERVEVEPGQQVTEGALLAKVHSPEIADAIARAVLTHQTLEREQRLHAERVTPARELERAQAEHRSACQQLRVLGFSEEQIEELEDAPEESVLLALRAPFDGEVVAMSAVRGARVTPGDGLFTVAHLDPLWAMLSLPESALGRVQTRQPVELRVDALPTELFHGTLTWIAAEVDARTRTVRARAEVANPDGRLKAGMFGRARILTGAAGSALTLPAGAVQRIHGRDFVFVQTAPDLFEARALELCTGHAGVVEVRAGLRPGEPVVTQGSFQLKSQFLLSRLGAGCTHE